MSDNASRHHRPHVEFGFPIVPIIFPFVWLFFSLTPPVGPAIGIPLVFPFLWIRDKKLSSTMMNASENED